MGKLAQIQIEKGLEYWFKYETPNKRVVELAEYSGEKYADYNPQTNSIDVTTFENYILRIDCNKAEDGLRTTPCSQNSPNALAIDEPLEYARLALDGEMQAWLDAIDSLEVW